jgi:hypothetical protein
VALALAVGAASYTLARTKISIPLREWLAKKQSYDTDVTERKRINKNIWYWLYTLFSCPYCLGHWLAAVAVLIYRPHLTGGWVVADLGVSWLAVVALASAVSSLIGLGIRANNVT